MQKGFYLDKALAERLESLTFVYEDKFDPQRIKTDFLNIEIKLFGSRKASLYECIKTYQEAGTLKKSYLMALSKTGISILEKTIYISVMSPIWSELFWEEPLKGARWFMQEMKAKYFPLLPIGKMHGAAYCLKLEQLMDFEICTTNEESL